MRTGPEQQLVVAVSLHQTARHFAVFTRSGRPPITLELDTEASFQCSSQHLARWQAIEAAGTKPSMLALHSDQLSLRCWSVASPRPSVSMCMALMPGSSSKRPAPLLSMILVIPWFVCPFGWSCRLPPTLPLLQCGIDACCSVGNLPTP